MADIAILCRRHVVRILDQVGAGITRQRQEKAYMTAFAAVGYCEVNIIPEVRRRRKVARTRSAGVVAHNALIQCRDMIGFLGYGPDRHIVRIAAVAGFAVAVNAIVEKVGCIRK